MISCIFFLKMGRSWKYFLIFCPLKIFFNRRLEQVHVGGKAVHDLPMCIGSLFFITCFSRILNLRIYDVFSQNFMFRFRAVNCLFSIMMLNSFDLNRELLPCKGQLISKADLRVFFWTKNQWKYFFFFFLASKMS